MIRWSFADQSMTGSHRVRRRRALAAVAGALAIAVAWGQPAFADNSVLIGKMTGEQCRARGGTPVEVVPTSGQNPDPVRACFADPDQIQIQGVQPSWLCPDGKTPRSATGGCPG